MRFTNILRIITLILLAFGLRSLCAQQPYFPDGEWQVKKPEMFHMNAQLVDSAVRVAINGEIKIERDLRLANYKAYSLEPNYNILGPMKSRGGPAGLIIKSGYIVAQWGDPRRVDMTFSVTKSFLSSVTGLAIDAGLISNVHDLVANYVWDGTFEGPHNAKITWEHLLTQSSDWSGNLFGLYDWADRPPKNGSIDDWKNRKLLEPGSHFQYNDVRVNVLAYSLLQVWRKPLPQVLKEKIMDPIGASTTWRWYGYENSYVNMDAIMVQSVSGGGHFGGGLFISALDQARFGLLFLRNGKWKNQQILSEQWIKAMRQPSSANKSYGYLWWLNEEGTWPNAPKTIFYALGFGGNYIIIDEEHDLIIVARWMDQSKMAEVLNLVIQSIEKQH